MNNLECGLKCDNPNCDWEDMSIKQGEYESWINKPCPKCGENVLTQDDYLRAVIVRMMASVINSMSPEDFATLSKEVTDEDIVRMKQDPLFADAEGLVNLLGNNNELVSMTIDTHNEIKVVSIKPAE